jgi:hypothetical protein
MEHWTPLNQYAVDDDGMLLFEVRIRCCITTTEAYPKRKAGNRLWSAFNLFWKGAMWGRIECLAILVAALLFLSNSAPVKKPPTRLKKPPTTIQKFDPFVGVKDSGKVLFNAFSNNAIANVFKNTYSFFYWLPRRNIPFDTPWKLFGEPLQNSLWWNFEWIGQLITL